MLIIVISGCSPSDFPVKSLDQSNIPENPAKSGGIRAIGSLILKQTVPLFKKPLLKYTLMICLAQFGMLAA